MRLEPEEHAHTGLPHVEVLILHAANRISADIQTDPPGAKDRRLQSRAVVDAELRTEGPGSASTCPNDANTGCTIGLDGDAGKLREQVGVIDQGIRATVKKIWAVGHSVFQANRGRGFEQSEAEHSEVSCIGQELSGGGGHRSRGLAQRDSTRVIKSTKNSEVVGAEWNDCRQHEKKTREVLHPEIIINRMYKDSGNRGQTRRDSPEGRRTIVMRCRFNNRFRSLSCLLILMLLAQPALAQVDQARQAIADDEHLEAIEILTPVVADNPSPDAYLYLGLAHANLSQNDRALELFDEALRRYPSDTRFHNETAGVHLANGDVEPAVEALQRALAIDASDEYASDLLASLRLSAGNVEEALAIWNRVDRPRINAVLENFSPDFIHWAVGRALTFGSGDILTEPVWKTTQARLFRSRLFSNVGLDIEPSGPDDLYNAIVRTSNRTNTRSEIIFDLVRGLPIETTYFDLWDVGFSGISWTSSFRWDKDRRRLAGELIVPLPLPSLPTVEFRDTWRSERWNLAPSIRDAFATQATFDYKVNSVGAELKLTPVHHVEFDMGFEYRNRDATGSIAVLGMDERNSGTLELGMVLHTFEGRYKNQLRIGGFVARESWIGDFSFSGGSLEIANRVEITRDARTVFDWSITGGTSGGNLPVDHYFILGLTSLTDFRLRGHVASDRGRYGKAPMGTDFVLLNTDIEHRLVTIPLFNALSIPYIEVKAMGFFDSAKTFDRQRVFRQNEWLNDIGAGLRFETPTGAFTILYGRDTSGGENNFYGYVERRFW